MTTAQQIIDRAMLPMRDANLSFFNPDELFNYINEAQNDIAMRQQLLDKEIEIDADVNGLVTPTDSTLILEFRWVVDVYGHELDWCSNSSYFQLVDEGYSDTSQPFVTAYDGSLHITPVPSNGVPYRVGYWGLPPQVNDTGDLLGLPLSFDDKTAKYVRAQCYYRLGEMELGNTELAQYNQGLYDSSRAYALKRPGRPVAAIEGNIFDLDPERAY